MRAYEHVGCHGVTGLSAQWGTFVIIRVARAARIMKDKEKRIAARVMRVREQN